MRSAAARFLGAGNGSRALSFVGGNGVNRGVSGSARIGGSVGVSVGSSGPFASSNYDGKGTYLIFNAGDTLFISDLNSHDKVLHFIYEFIFLGCRFWCALIKVDFFVQFFIFRTRLSVFTSVIPTLAAMLSMRMLLMGMIYSLACILEMVTLFLHFMMSFLCFFVLVVLN